MSDQPAVIVVDDEPDHAMVVRLVLLGLAPHAAVSVVTDTRQMVEDIKAAPKGALVLVDRLLGAYDGAAVVHAVRQARKDLCLVLLSAFMSDEDRERALAAGADAAVEKPGNLAGWRGLLSGLLPPGAGTAVDDPAASYTAAVEAPETAGP